MKKIVEIESCTVCPHEGWAGDWDGLTCSLSTPLREIPIGTYKIPDWCPLPNSTPFLMTPRRRAPSALR